MERAKIKKKYVRKITQHEEKFFQLSFKVQLSFNFVFLQKSFRLQKDSASLFTRGIIENIILSCFNFSESSK